MHNFAPSASRVTVLAAGAHLSWIICGPPSTSCPCTVGATGASGVSSGSPPSTRTGPLRRTLPPSQMRPASLGRAGSLQSAGRILIFSADVKAAARTQEGVYAGHAAQVCSCWIKQHCSMGASQNAQSGRHKTRSWRPWNARPVRMGQLPGNARSGRQTDCLW